MQQANFNRNAVMPQGYKTSLHLLLTVCLWQDLIFLDVLVAHSFSKLLHITLQGAKTEKSRD